MDRRNYFKKGGDTSIKTFDLKNENFPELIACKTAEKSQLNYKFAIETEDIIEEITDELKPGWISMNYDNGLIVVNGETDSAEPVWNPDKGIQQMVDNWELYRTNYIHGVEEYDKLYNMPQNADYLDIDSEEEEEEDEDAGEED